MEKRRKNGKNRKPRVWIGPKPNWREYRCKCRISKKRREKFKDFKKKKVYRWTAKVGAGNQKCPRCGTMRTPSLPWKWNKKPKGRRNISEKKRCQVLGISQGSVETWIYKCHCGRSWGSTFTKGRTMTCKICSRIVEGNSNKKQEKKKNMKGKEVHGIKRNIEESGEDGWILVPPDDPNEDREKDSVESGHIMQFSGEFVSSIVESTSSINESTSSINELLITPEVLEEHEDDSEIMKKSTKPKRKKKKKVVWVFKCSCGGKWFKKRDKSVVPEMKCKKCHSTVIAERKYPIQ